MSAEHSRSTQEFSREAVLDHVDAIAGTNPVSHALLPGGIAMDFCVGRRAPRAEGEEPMQVIVARVPEQGEQSRMVTVASRLLSQEWPYLVHIEKEHGHDILADGPVEPHEVTTLDTVLSETDFSVDQGAPVQELQARLETPGRYQRWIEVMLDQTPLVDLV